MQQKCTFVVYKKKTEKNVGEGRRENGDEKKGKREDGVRKMCKWTLLSIHITFFKKDTENINLFIF